MGAGQALGRTPDESGTILRGGEGRGAWGASSVGGRGQEMVEQDGDFGLSPLREVGDRGGCPWLVERES